MLEFIELICNPKGFAIKLIILILFIVFFWALRNWNDTVIYICLWIFSLAVLYWIVSSIKNSKNNTEKWLKAIRIVALIMLVFLCYEVESQTVLYIYLWMMWLLFIYTLWIVVSRKIKETKDKLKDTSLKEEMWKSIADFMKWPDKWL